jgi:hypothetical protein
MLVFQVSLLAAMATEMAQMTGSVEMAQLDDQIVQLDGELRDRKQRALDMRRRLDQQIRL